MTHITTMAKMRDQASPLSREDVRQEAGDILSAMDRSRRHQTAFEANWRKLWQLVREARAGYLPFQNSPDGPWHFSTDRSQGVNQGSTTLAAGDFILPVWPSEEPRSSSDLPGLLNWAAVPIPGIP
jgi:hypothetical protein